MHTKSKLTVVATLGAMTMVAAPALAQEEAQPYFQRALSAPKSAFELTVLPGYSQPFGDIERGFSIRDTAGGGGSVQLGAGTRITPHWGLALTGSYGQYGNGDGRATFVNAGDASSATAGIEGSYHILPYGRVDPFVALGTGWRGMWERHDGPSNDTFRHGLSIARVSLGVDFRISRDVAIAPVIAGDANIFLWQNPEGVTGASTTIANPRVNMFLSAGLQGRFDLAGERVDRYGTRTSTTTTTGVEVERMPEPMPMPVTRPAPVQQQPVAPPPRQYPVDPMPMQR